MLKEDLKEKLLRFQPSDEFERVDREKMLTFREEPNCFERSLSFGHFTGSCWLVNRDETKFLLTLHKKIGLWLQLGGHADGDSDLAAVALKEAREESGLQKIELVSEEIFDISIHRIDEYKGIPAHYHYDVRFLLKSEEPDDAVKISEESEDLKWFDEPLPTFEPSIFRMYRKWKARQNLQ